MNEQAQVTEIASARIKAAAEIAKAGFDSIAQAREKLAEAMANKDYQFVFDNKGVAAAIEELDKVVASTEKTGQQRLNMKSIFEGGFSLASLMGVVSQLNVVENKVMGVFSKVASVVHAMAEAEKMGRGVIAPGTRTITPEDPAAEKAARAAATSAQKAENAALAEKKRILGEIQNVQDEYKKTTLANIQELMNAELEKARKVGLSEQELTDYRIALAHKYESAWKAAIEKTRDESNNAMAGMQHGLYEWSKQQGGLFRQGEDAAKQFMDGTSQAFTSAFQSFANGSMTAKQAFQSFAQSVVSNILQITTRMLIMNALTSAFGGGGAATGGLGALFSTPLMGGGGGGAGGMLGMFGAKFGDGGIVTKPTVALIGERGQDEAVIPLGPNRTLPVMSKGSRRGGGGDNKLVSVGFTVVANDTRGFDNLLMERKDTIIALFHEALSKNVSTRTLVRSSL